MAEVWDQSVQALRRFYEVVVEAASRVSWDPVTWGRDAYLAAAAVLLVLVLLIAWRWRGRRRATRPQFLLTNGVVALLGEHDPAAAAALLERAGWVDRNGDGVRENAQGRPLRFDLLTSDAPLNRAVVEVVQQSFAAAVRLAPEIHRGMPGDPQQLRDRMPDGYADHVVTAAPGDRIDLPVRAPASRAD